MGKFTRMNRASRLWPAVLALAALAACNKMGANELVNSADGYLKKGQTKSALIQLKEALSENPNHARARLLLGQTLLDGGDAASAVVELKKAQQLGVPAEQVTPPLVRALVAAGQYQAVVDGFATWSHQDAKAAADVTTSVAAAYAFLNKMPAAHGKLQDALSKQPDFPPTLLLEARIAGFERRTDEAAALMDKVLTLTPNDPQAWFQKGELLILVQNRRADALAAFRKALEIQPAHTGARAALADALISQNDLKAAAEQLAELRKYAQNPLQFNYLSARLAFAEGDLKKSMAAIELAQKVAPNAPQLLQLAGSVQLSSGALLQAERSFSKNLSITPENSVVRKLLAQTQLRMGQSAKALATLQPLLAGNASDAQAYALAGEAELALNKPEASQASFQAAVGLDPSNAANQVKLTLAKQKTAGYAATVAALHKIAAEDKGTNADLALVSVLLQNKDLEAALNALDAVEAKLPKNPLPHNLRAKIQLLRNDPRAARQSFERALAIDPVFVPAVAGLAALDIRENNIAAAKRRFEAVLKISPSNMEVLLAMVQLRASEGAPKAEMVEMLSQAVRLNPTEPAPRVKLIDLQLREGNPKAAQAAARDAVAALPEQADLVDALGRAEMASGATEQALAAFSKLATLEPTSTRPFMRLAAVQLASNKMPAAERNLRRALEIAPDYLDAQRALIKMAVGANRWADAIAISRSVQSQRPNETTGYDIEAEINTTRGRPEDAADVYRRALRKYPVTIMAVKLHTALRATGKTAEADRMAGEWQSAHPSDVEFPAYLGEVALGKQQFATAEQQFRKVVAARPESAEALNNIAFAMVKQGKPGAVTYAEQALKLRPGAAGIMDTLASALAAEGQLSKALEVQRRAVSANGNDLMLRLNLANLLLQAGDKPAAQAELKTLEQAGERFAGQAEVSRLLKSL